MTKRVIVLVKCGHWSGRKWKKRKAKAFARLGPDGDSNHQRNKKVLYQANVFLNFQNPESPPNPLDNGYHMNNNLCVPIMYTKPSLPDNLVSNISLEHDFITEDNESDSDESIDSIDRCIDDDLDI